MARIIEDMKICGRHVTYMGETRNSYIILVGKPEGKGPFGRLGLNGKIILK
jgi:hypothetical protein